MYLQPKWMTKCLWRIPQQNKNTARWWHTTACNEYGSCWFFCKNEQHRLNISNGCHHHQVVLKCWAQKTVVFKSRNLHFRHNTTVFWGACSLSSCNTCSARKGVDQMAQRWVKTTTTKKQPRSEHANGATLITPTQAGGDTTTWSVCTCWPEAVTTGASVCSCTAVTVPCACR